MNITSSQRTALESILKGAPTPYDVREFVRLCYVLALPLIRKKIANGSIPLESLGMKQQDVVYDCIAEVFVRNEAGRFREVESFFTREIGDPGACSDALLCDTLRRIVFSKVNVNLIRLHQNADPVLGRILHNLDVTLGRTVYFERFIRFGETMLACTECDLSLDRCVPPMEYLREQFARVVLIHDSMAVMLKKLRGVLADQDEFQRAIPFLSVGLLLKEVYALAREPADEYAEVSPLDLGNDEARRYVGDACESVRSEFHESYVAGGKLSGEVFRKLMEATRNILLGTPTSGSTLHPSYYDYLHDLWPGLTKEEYILRYKSVQEYFVKVVRARLTEFLKREYSAGERM